MSANVSQILSMIHSREKQAKINYSHVVIRNALSYGGSPAAIYLHNEHKVNNEHFSDTNNAQNNVGRH